MHILLMGMMETDHIGFAAAVGAPVRSAAIEETGKKKRYLNPCFAEIYRL